MSVILAIEILKILFIAHLNLCSIIIIYSHFHRDIIGIKIMQAKMKSSVLPVVKRGDSPVKMNLDHVIYL